MRNCVRTGVRTHTVAVRGIAAVRIWRTDRKHAEEQYGKHNKTEGGATVVSCQVFDSGKQRNEGMYQRSTYKLLPLKQAVGEELASADGSSGVRLQYNPW